MGSRPLRPQARGGQARAPGPRAPKREGTRGSPGWVSEPGRSTPGPRSDPVPERGLAAWKWVRLRRESTFFRSWGLAGGRDGKGKDNGA